MSNKIYESEVKINEEDTKVLKRILVNHLLVYNYSLGLLYDNPEIRFETLGKKSAEYVKREGISPVLKTAVHNELHYQYKKFRKNVKVQKQLTDIQYITFTVGSYYNSSFTMSKDGKTISLNGVDVVLELEHPLPESKGYKMYYFNVSYSSVEDRFMMSVYGTN